MPAWSSSVQDSKKQYCHDIVILFKMQVTLRHRDTSKGKNKPTVLVAWPVLLRPTELLHLPLVSLPRVREVLFV